ncbi:MAG TPA: hypothetical protein VHE53_04300 [Patescibacteria group bacterium]|nr:hypothetical protein [Patescibacteria group bacterium]
MKKFANVLGWYGALATLTAYFLVSFGITGPKDLTYQLLNLTGAIGLATICYYKKTYQPLFVNIIWGVIALLAVANIIFMFTK